MQYKKFMGEKDGPKDGTEFSVVCALHAQEPDEQANSIINGTFHETLASFGPLLTTIKIMDRGLENLPADLFGLLPSLAELNLAKNKFSQLPAGISTLSLITLDVSHNSFTGMDIENGKLQETLTEINISHNPLQGIPNALYSFRKLRNLQADHIFLSSLPDDFGKLESLEVFSCRGNTMAMWPAVLGTLPALKELDMAGVPWLDTGNKLSLLSRQHFQAYINDSPVLSSLDKKVSFVLDEE